CPYERYFVAEHNVEIEESIEWAKQIGMMKQDSRFHATQNAVYYMRQYENFVPGGRLLISKIITLLYMFDDFIDDARNVEKTDIVIEIFQHLKGMFDENYTLPAKTDDDDPLLNATREIVEDVKKFYNLPNYRLKRAIEIFLASVKFEMKVRRRRNAGKLFDYEFHRMYSAGTELSLEMTKPLIKVNINNLLAQTQCFYVAYESCLKLTYLINDLFGIVKDIKENSQNNYVVCLRNETESWQQAINETAKSLSDELKAFELALKLTPYEGILTK
ncbi:hypothetical protein B4U80_12384, partial [Leptotrombidium deliense]